jgi:hypothetical protein
MALLASAGSGFAADEQTLLGDALDARVSRCGVVVGSEDMAVVRPFIEASTDVSGSFQLFVEKSSASGSSSTSQGSSFGGGTLGEMQAVFDRPSNLQIRLTVTGEDGSPLCTLDEQLQLDGTGRI